VYAGTSQPRSRSRRDTMNTSKASTSGVVVNAKHRKFVAAGQQAEWASSPMRRARWVATPREARCTTRKPSVPSRTNV
jgi:hypothetical protein